MNPKIERTADKHIYLEESRYKEPKEMFKAVGRMIRQSGLLASGGRICDIGCAAGEFLYYVHQEFPGAECYGYDIVEELLEKGRSMVPDAKFEAGSVLDPGLLSPESADICALLGVHQIFDEFETCFDNLLRWTRPGGCVYVDGLFNPHPVDVWVKYRLASDSDADHREAGWNMYSRETVGSFLESRELKDQYTFTPFEMPFDIPQNSEDIARTWTFKAEDGRRLLTNGLSLLVNYDILEIRLPENWSL